jgi:hypothetical protein
MNIPRDMGRAERPSERRTRASAVISGDGAAAISLQSISTSRVESERSGDGTAMERRSRRNVDEVLVRVIGVWFWCPMHDCAADADAARLETGTRRHLTLGRLLRLAEWRNDRRRPSVVTSATSAAQESTDGAGID